MACFFDVSKSGITILLGLYFITFSFPFLFSQHPILKTSIPFYTTTIHNDFFDN